ncbi:hypothetical protein OHB06_30785 [Streptomyces sp. NBC_01604]|uniref:hypothetical protein n=1 Tax=unclassified Streptomyces TaxID=2593676 RepID=UPI0038676B2B
MLYDVTLPGEAPVTHLCPGCERPFGGSFRRKQIDDWSAAVEQGEATARAYLERSGALTLAHTAVCDFKGLPLAVLALCPREELVAHYYKARAVLGDS